LKKKNWETRWDTRDAFGTPLGPFSVHYCSTIPGTHNISAALEKLQC
jgi:hypothetical protein